MHLIIPLVSSGMCKTLFARREALEGCLDGARNLPESAPGFVFCGFGWDMGCCNHRRA